MWNSTLARKHCIEYPRGPTEGIGSWSYQQKFVRHEYFLTEKGQSLWPGLAPSFLEPLLIKVK
jgi:hypothetical protein